MAEKANGNSIGLMMENSALTVLTTARITKMNKLRKTGQPGDALKRHQTRFDPSGGMATTFNSAEETRRALAAFCGVPLQKRRTKKGTKKS